MRAKVLVVQPYIPLYNVALFEALSSSEDMQLVVVADLHSKSQLNQYDPAKHQFTAVHCRICESGGLVFRPGLLKRIRENYPDVLVLSGSPRDVTQLGIALLWRLRGKPVAAWGMFHRIGPRRRVTEWATRIWGSLAHVLMVYADKGKRELLRLGVSQDKIRIISTAIDTAEIEAVQKTVTPLKMAEFRRRERLDGVHIVLHVVRLTEIKRADVTLRAFEKLTKQRSDCVLVFIGGGPLEGEMRKLADDLGISAAVRFVGPVYDQAVLAYWFSCASMFVMATCIGLSIHHAMSYGLPVISDDSAETQASEAEVLRDGENGLVYRSGDVAHFCECMKRLLDDEELRKRLGEEALRTVTQEFTLEGRTKRFQSTVKELWQMRLRGSDIP